MTQRTNHRLTLKLMVVLGALLVLTTAEAQGPMNLLLNSQFDFHSFDNSRSAQARTWSSNQVASWNTDAWGDITVTVAPHIETLRPVVPVRNVVTLRPGKRLYQVIFLPDIGVRHGDTVSLQVFGRQQAAGCLQAAVHVLKIDSQTGTWKPSDLGMSDTREFPRHARGELVRAASYSARSAAGTDVVLKLEKCLVPGQFVHKDESADDQLNTIALQVELSNPGTADALVYGPCLVAGEQARAGLRDLRPLPTDYRGIPRTLRKLWRGEPLHIMVMGSSIDRGSANPPMYAYDEDPASPKFKQPLGQDLFNGELVGRPDLTATVGQWRHYYAWAGRLRTELLTRFNYPPEKLLLHYMACDGSSISEATSGLPAYASLSLPPSPEVNGQPAGKTWQEMYPGLFDRPQGPGPDLVLFGSGANEKTDQPDEGALFEATIRWLQRHYPDCEFLFCMWQRDRSYTPNVGHLQELALSYQIPYLDLADRMDQLLGYANRFTLCPRDGHPQAAGHYIWFKTLEQAFQVADPLVAGQAQRFLPRRLYPTSYGWEGEIRTFEGDSPRLKGNLLMLEDTAVNLWGEGGEKPAVLVDGERKRDVRSGPRRDLRNSLFTYGRLSLGDRHIVELTGDNPRITAADCKVCPNRQFLGIDNPRWNLAGKTPAEFKSEWGAPCGNHLVRLAAGEAIEIEAVGTDLSVAYLDEATGGALRVLVDGQERLTLTANVPYKDSTGREHYLENRRGLRGLGYGTHRVRLEVTEGQVSVLGVFTYDARSNREGERQWTGPAAPGEVITLTPPLGARPVVVCTGGLTCRPEDLTRNAVRFSGSGGGTYIITGE